MLATLRTGSAERYAVRFEEPHPTPERPIAVKTLPLSLAVLIAIAPIAQGCAAIDEPIQATSAGPTTAPATPDSGEWACTSRTQTGFTTDPVVYGVNVPLAEIAAQMNAGTFDIARTGRRATVTFRDDHGLIRQRLEYSRGRTTGWQLARGRTCSLG